MAITIIKAIRKHWKLTAPKVGKYTGFKDYCIYNVEAGRKSWQSIRSKLSEFYGMPVEQLFDEEGWPLQLTDDTILPPKPTTPPIMQEPIMQEPEPDQKESNPVMQLPCAVCGPGEHMVCLQCYNLLQHRLNNQLALTTRYKQVIGRAL